MMRRAVWITLLAMASLVVPGCHPPPSRNSAEAQSVPRRLSFDVSVARELQPGLEPSGRLFVILGAQSDPEPRFSPGWAGPGAEPFFARDIRSWRPGEVKVLGPGVIGFPPPRLGDLAPGTYFAQALYDTNTVDSSINAPGNLVSKPVAIVIPQGNDSRRYPLVLDCQLPPETVPSDTRLVKVVRIQSQRLSEFWHRPMYLRAAVILPSSYDQQPGRRYPVRYHIGGFHARYTTAFELMKEGSFFRSQWLAPGAPQMIFVFLDGEAPYGDSYQMNSANNGPYGDATVDELIPAIDSRFRTVASARGRFLEGESTGGWVSLALQIFYPGTFNGAWSFCADSVDFRRFQLIDIYSDVNAFVNQYGLERPSMRDIDGEPRYTIRHEVAMERVLGRGDRFVSSGEQWGSWNAVYSPRAADGEPAAIWDGVTGVIDHQVAAQWKEKFDLRAYLDTHWRALGPKLQGKLHIWMGDMDSFYLNDAMELLSSFLKATRNPTSDAEVTFGRRQGHCWVPLSEKDLMGQMLARFEATSATADAGAPRPPAGKGR